MKDSLKIYGSTPESILTFKDHNNDQLRKAYAKTKAVMRIKRFVAPDVIIRLYTASAQPHLEYCGLVLIIDITDDTETQSSKLDDTNFYKIR